MGFGELVKKYRLAQNKSLRRFCEEHDYDPGNQSKLERNINKPPQDEKSLRKLAFALGLSESSEKWEEFMDAAYLANGKIPKYVPDNDEVLEMLPVFLELRVDKRFQKKK
jgi:transcriptional regulator with XRE-family HTH domain